MEWNLFTRLGRWLQFKCHALAENISVLLLAVMAKGFGVHVRGKDNSYVEIGAIMVL